MSGPTGFASVLATPSAMKRDASSGVRKVPTTIIGTGSVMRVVEQRLDERQARA